MLKTLLRNIFQSNWGVAAGLFLIILSAYSFSLNSDFRVLDDYTSIIQNDTLGRDGGVKKIFTTSFFGGNTYYRPLVALSFFVEKKMFGLAPVFFHSTNILIHSLVAYFVFCLAGLILRKRETAVLAATLFALHPVHWEAVSSIAGRSVILCAMWYLAAFIFYCKGREKKHLVYVLASLGSFSLALLSKEEGVTLPVLILSYEYFIKGNNGLKRLGGSLLRAAPYLFMVAAYLALRRAIGITHIELWPSVSAAGLGVATFLRAVLTYLRLFIFPYDLHFDRARVYFQEWANPELLATLFFYGSFACVLFLKRKRITPEVKFFLSWFFLCLLPVSQVLPIFTQANYAAASEHLIYIPSIGIFTAFALLYHRLEEKLNQTRIINFRLIKAVFISFILFLFMTTVTQNIYAGYEFAVLQQALKHAPYNVRVRNSYAVSLAMKNLYDEAQGEFRKILEIEPWNVKARIGLGLTLVNRGRYFEGIKEYEKISEAGNNEQLLNENLNIAYEKLLEQYQGRLAADENNPVLYYSLAVAYTKNNQMEEAVSYYKKALDIDPQYKNALFNLASIYDAEGKTDEAFQYYLQFERCHFAPDELNAYVYLRMADIYKKKGDAINFNRYFFLASELIKQGGWAHLKEFLNKMKENDQTSYRP